VLIEGEALASGPTLLSVWRAGAAVPDCLDEAVHDVVPCHSQDVGGSALTRESSVCGAFRVSAQQV